ncbi:hypothetical protein [Kurthia sibirica]|uniref:Uncharacterized protein n=1 Tax=Kurthia sibirica TaxID=202750 RepID=A0A2U3AQ47_9BACL|nr:hypothetical protein [Kurthia sibirica]PWI26680.1 hypothetical protein DEX24_02680 [Kurthia sibirica]
MFKKRPLKIQVSGCSGVAIICFLALLIILLGVTIPFFSFLGLSTLLEKFNLINLDYYSHWYQNFLYFGWLLILILALVFIIDLLALFIMASFNLDYSPMINLLSTMLQFAISTIVYFLVYGSLFHRIDLTWLGASITMAILYLIISTFTTSSIAGPTPDEE